MKLHWEANKIYERKQEKSYLVFQRLKVTALEAWI
jgi:hypothetical protein